MEITIHNVGAGCCHEVLFPNGARYLLDAGQSSEHSWWPSIEYMQQNIDRLIIQNLDEDHVADFGQLDRCASIKSIFSNPTVTASALRRMKPEGMRAGVQAIYRFLQREGPGHVGPLPNAGDARVRSYCNSYGLDFVDTNNLSVVTFVSWGRFTIFFGGDMAEPGWQRLLKSPSFRAELPDVNVYVASHHGRDDGRCDELMKLMQPDVVIFSDKRKQHETQETTQWYRNRTRGILDISKGPPYGLADLRYVLTTRRDGTMKILVKPNGSYTILVNPPQSDLMDLFLNPPRRADLGSNLMK